jgi:lipopolysaccharide/colanic/teichoic acid biosynthesis glycosyltransferase
MVERAPALAAAPARRHAGGVVDRPARWRRGPRTPAGPVGGQAAVSPTTTRRGDRTLDVVVASVLLVLLSPALAVCALAVKVGDRGSVLFRQLRIGRGGEPFEILKFRTMVVGATDDLFEAMAERELLQPDSGAGTSDGVFKIEHDPRVTRAGALLRRYSLDELPQLVNVLRGDMALVGPRPLLPFEVEHLDSRERQRHLVRPGLTGLWQVSGRNRMSTRAMLRLDVDYVRQRSWRLDLRILARTPAAVLRGDGAR